MLHSFTVDHAQCNLWTPALNRFQGTSVSQPLQSTVQWYWNAVRNLPQEFLSSSGEYQC